MTTKEIIIAMDDKLHPLGSLMYESSYGTPSTIWRVIAHREYPPIKLCGIELVRQEVYYGN